MFTGTGSYNKEITDIIAIMRGTCGGHVGALPGFPATPAAGSAVGKHPAALRGPLHCQVPPHPKTGASGAAHKELSV